MALSTQPHLSATDMIRSAFSSLALHAALVIIWLLRPGTLHAQGDVRHPDSLRIYCALDTPFIDQLFNAQFTKIIDPEANTNIGNYVALETKDAALTLGASSSFANGSILALKVSGGVDENIASIWADRNVNSNFSADVQYHFLHKPYRLGTDSANLERAPAKGSPAKKRRQRSHRIIEADSDSCDAMKARMLKLRSDYAMKWHDIEQRMDTVLLSREIDKIGATIRGMIRDSIARHEAMLGLTNILNAGNSLAPDKRDSLATVISKLAGKDSIEFAVRKATFNELFTTVIPGVHSLLEDLNRDAKVDLVHANRTAQDKRAELIERKRQSTFAMQSVLYHTYLDQREALLGSMAVMGMDLSWWSIGYGFNAEKFKLFDATKTYPTQIENSAYGSHEFRFQYSRYNRFILSGKQDPGTGRFKWLKNYFVSSGVALGLTDNHNELKESSVEQRIQHGPDTLSRTEVSTYKVLQGDYQHELRSLRVFTDFYWFFLKSKSHAVHLYPSYTVKDKTTPSLDVGIGILLGYVKKDTPKNAVNFEIFLLLNDAANGASEDSNAIGRSDFGLRVSVPFNFPQQAP